MPATPDRNSARHRVFKFNASWSIRDVDAIKQQLQDVFRGCNGWNDLSNTMADCLIKRQSPVPIPDFFQYRNLGIWTDRMVAQGNYPAWRQATAREHHIKFDWAQEVASLLDGSSADCERITLVCDNLTRARSVHSTNAFESERAPSYVRRIDIRFTPKHGSWLNIADV